MHRLPIRGVRHQADAAISQIRGTASLSPLAERRAQRSLALSIDYQWQNYSV